MLGKIGPRFIPCSDLLQQFLRLYPNARTGKVRYFLFPSRTYRGGPFSSPGTLSRISPFCPGVPAAVFRNQT